MFIKATKTAKPGGKATRFLIPGLLILCAPSFAAAPVNGPKGQAAAGLTVVDQVDPMIGTGTDCHGHTYPGAVYPFGMVQLSPDTGTEGWDHCSGYSGADKTIIGFTHSHLSGTGCPDLGDILLQPGVGDILLNPGDERKPGSGYRSSFRHEDEKAGPGYYSVILKDSGIKVELTATAHAGMHRYTFPAGSRPHVIIDLVHGISSNPRDAVLKVEDRDTLSGYRRSSGWAQDKAFYFVAKFSKPFESFGLQAGGQLLTGTSETRDRNVRGYVSFAAAAGPSISVRIGLSPTSIEEARKNLDAEVPDFDFDKTCARTRQAWARQLGVIDVECPDPAARCSFYTALYHSMLAPHLYNNADQSYMGADHKIHACDFDYYSTFSVWDQFRAWFPLMTLIQPQRINPLIRGMLLYYDQLGQHSLPVWPLCSNETWCMIGYHTVPMIALAYRLGFRDYDVERLYAAMRDTALNARSGQAEFHQRGWIASPNDGSYAQTVSKTLEFAFDDWCIAQVAASLGKKEDYALFSKYAGNYRNVFDSGTKFMRGRHADGSWRTPFVPNEFYRPDYTEADAWQYTWFVPQDMNGLIALMGGAEGFATKLDSLFDQDPHIIAGTPDITGLMGQYAQGNEPSHGFAYLFNYAGQPYRTQKRVRQIMETLYNDTADGIPGNDDCGQMSAWYVFGCLGLYPANPADGTYMIGSPLFSEATLHLDEKTYKGAEFRIVARNNSHDNIYIQSAMLDGHPLHRAWLRHGEIAAGGTLELVMGPKPNKTWGSGPENLPAAADLSP